jgi:hypothetical protein
VPEQEAPINYPDLLGGITAGPRLNLDVIQCAVAVRPPQIPAGQFLEIVLLLQNASDIDVDVVVTTELPEQDQNKAKGRFTPKSPRLRVGLRPAEVGYMILPVGTSPLTQPAPDYLAGLNLAIKHVGKKPQRVRALNGGGPFVLQELPKEAQQPMQALQTLRFVADPGKKKNHVQTTFAVLPPALASLKALKELKAEWISLWTMRDYLDQYTIAQRVWDVSQAVVGQLKRDAVFLPLLKTTQERFQACEYALLPPEAIFVTKLLTLMLEMGVNSPTPADPRPAWPRWFVRLCRLLFHEPGLATQTGPLVSRQLYIDLVHDAVLHGFTMVSTVTDEKFGTAEESARYADDLVDALANQKPLDVAHAYLPLVMGGLIANARVTMPREQVRETVFILSKALQKRRPEKTQDNAFVFDLTVKLIERALDAT